MWVLVAAAALVVSFVLLVVSQRGSDSGSDVDGPGRGVVRGLITEADEDEVRVAEIGSGDEFVFANRDESVSVEHLEEHRRDGLPVIITWSAGSDGRKVAVAIADG